MSAGGIKAENQDVRQVYLLVYGTVCGEFFMSFFNKKITDF